MKNILIAFAIFSGFSLEAVIVQEMGFVFDTKLPEEFESFKEYIEYKLDESFRLCPHPTMDIWTEQDLLKLYYFNGKIVSYYNMLDYLNDN